MRRAPGDPEPAKRWLAFLRNYREAIAAIDFFTVPTITFSVLYSIVVIRHDRRRILHFNVTKHPISLWIVQQLREAFPFGSAPGFVIFDRDAQYGAEVPAAIRSMKIKCVRTSFESPWQNGVAVFAKVKNYYPEVPFVFYSRKITPEGTIRVLKAGVVDAIRKGALQKEQVLA
jgi:hypothetical protein